MARAPGRRAGALIVLSRTCRSVVGSPGASNGAEMNRRMVKVLAGAAVVAAMALGGSAIARATGAFDDEGDQLRGPEAERAAAAALRATDGGTVNAVERDDENGATYEVEVTRTDGSTVDVRLDASFDLVVIEGDTETADSGESG